MEAVVARAEGILIEMLDSDDPRRQERAVDKILELGGAGSSASAREALTVKR